MAKIWLTGSRGFIGRPCVHALRNAGVEVICFTQSSKDTPMAEAKDAPIHMDYLNPVDIKAKVERLGLPNVFIHLGWGEVSRPEHAYHLNEGVEGGKNLIETLFGLGLQRFIITGSISQYGGIIGRLSEEMQPGERLTNYAKAKNEVEAIGLQVAQEYNKTFICVRIPWAFGAGQRQGSLINDLFQAYLKSTPVSLSPCEHYRDYIHMVDVVEGLKRICDVNESGVINLGSGKYVQVKEYVIELWKQLGADMNNLKFGARPLGSNEPDQPKSWFDLTRLKRLTKWQPTLSLQEGIAQTIEDLKLEAKEAVHG